MKTKIIPFDLETAKKIQVGEIEGKIIRNSSEAEILDFNLYFKGQTYVCAKTKGNSGEYTTRLFDIYGKDAESSVYYNLVLEVPDNEPQFKVGDKVRVRPNDTHSHFVKQYDNCIGKIVGEYHEYFVVIVTGAFQDQFLADELELVEETEKHEFKPFEKVLAKDCDSDEWQCDLFSHIQDDTESPYVTVGHMWRQCIPYEGNEHLVGTTDKPKED